MIHKEALNRSQFFNVVMGKCRYQNPNLINADLAMKIIDRLRPTLGEAWEDIYVLPAFLKPGKHTFLVDNCGRHTV
jgi:hypothetical protein